MSRAAVYIIGAGRVGAALGVALKHAGAPPAGLWTRSPARAARLQRDHGLACAAGALPEGIGQAELVVLAASDPAVPLLAGALLDGGLLRSARAVLHCGGGRPAADALCPILGHLPVGTFHPLLAVSEVGRGAASLAGATIALEGDAAARELGRQLASTLGGVPLELEGAQLALYHAAAVMASNHSLALVAAAQGLLEELGLSPGRAGQALGPLLRSVMENYAAQGCLAALTGPVVRGDPETINRHLVALEALPGQARELYLAGTRAALAVAGQEADPPLQQRLEQIRQLLR